MFHCPLDKKKSLDQESRFNFVLKIKNGEGGRELLRVIRRHMSLKNRKQMQTDISMKAMILSVLFTLYPQSLAKWPGI